MNQFIKSILQTKTIYVLLSLLAFCILVDFSYFEYTATDEIRNEYRDQEQAKQEAETYDEHDDLMVDFKDDLAEINLEQVENTKVGSAYWDDIYFNVYYVTILTLVSCLGLCFLIFIGFHFSKQYSKMPFVDVFKSTLFAYFIFPLSSTLVWIWFGLIQTDYQFIDTQHMYARLNPSIQSLLGSPEKYQWYNYLMQDMKLQSLIFVLLIPFFLKQISGSKYTDLLKKMIIPFVGFFIIYHIVSPYTDFLIY